MLKENFNASNCFKEHSEIGEAVVTPTLPTGAMLYVFDNMPKPPWWRQYFGIETPLNQALKGAILLLPVEGRTFCITFGHVAHKLFDTAYQYDFGMQVTLNCLDPEKSRILTH